MKLHVKGRNVKVTPALRAYAHEKIGHLERYLDRILDAHVTLRRECAEQIVDVVLTLKHHLIKAEERSPDMYASIDMVRDRLEQQIRKFKTKYWDHHPKRNGARRPAARARGSQAAEEPADDADKSLRIARRKRLEIAKMSLEDAVLQMDLLGHDFFLYRSDQTGAVNVLYKRRGGDLGLIETVL